MPSGGLLIGTEVVETEAQQAMWGSVTDESVDQCYHQECDDIDNPDLHSSKVNFDAVAHVACTWSPSVSLQAVA